MSTQLPKGFVLDQPAQSQLPEGFILDEAPAPTPQEPVAEAVAQEQAQDPTFMDKASEMFTGKDRMTPEMESMQEIGAAPELNALSMGALKASFGLLAAGDEEGAIGTIKQNIPEAKFSKDSKGNVIVNLPSGQFALNKPGLSPQDAMKGIFDVAAFTPAGRARTLLGAGAGAAGTELAIEAAGSQLGAGDISPMNVAGAGALGLGGKFAENVIGSGYRAAKGRIAPEQKQLIESGKEAGVPVMTSDVIEPQTFAGKMARSTGEKIPFVGTGAARAQQQEARQEAVQQFADKYQAPSYADIVQSLKDKSKGIKASAGNILNKTGVKLDEVSDIPVDQTREAIDEAMEVLTRPNVRVDQAAIDELNTLSELMSMPQTFSSLKDNRSIASDILESFGKGERSQLPTRSKSLLQKAVVGMKRDMDEFAKENLEPKEYSSWKKANAVYAGEAEKLKKTKIKNILDKGDVTPENVSTMLFSQKPSEVKKLYESLTTKGKQNARSALVFRAFDNASKRAGGITPSTFNTELKKIAKNTDVFFRGKDRAQLEGFKRLMSATRRAQEAAVETPTGQQILGAGAGYAAFTDLGATLGAGGTAGGLARLYESAPVRNALLRLGSVPTDSDQYLKALSVAQSALTAAAQSERRGE